MSAYQRRYTGMRWSILYGAYESVARYAVNELQRAVQDYLPYVVEARPAGGEPPAENLILAGTPADNRLIAALVEQGRIALPAGEQGYTVACAASPFAAAARMLVVAGSDPRGVLYGVEDLNARLLGGRLRPDGWEQRRAAFDGMPDFQVSEAPAIAARGLWSWGYVIYDYRRYLDHMARLKMNRLVIWNDCPPRNIQDIIAYAHDRGIEIILGFQWGWGLELDLANPDDRQAIKRQVVDNFRQNYRGLGMDGIYFQTLTEHDRAEMGGQSVAALSCRMVNDIAAALYDIEPELYIQFGLHATSIRDHYTALADLNPGVTIVWEDAGEIPYAYDPVTTGWGQAWDAVSTPEGTLEYARRLAGLRPGAEFALVPKGWICLRWLEEFEHHGPYILGERGREFTRRRLADRQPRWDYVNSLWLQNYPYAARFYREMLDAAPRISATGLVEDGLFEEAIQPSVALFAQTLWNPRRNDGELLELALSPYYRQQDA